MYFVIPSTVQIKEHSGASYTLCKEFGSSALPPFAKKKLLSLAPGEVEERRQQLENYLRHVSKTVPVTVGSTLHTFLHTSLEDNHANFPQQVRLDIYLMNGSKTSVLIAPVLLTDSVLEAVASQIELPDEFVFYFGLFIVRQDGDGGGSSSVIRWLSGLEAPFIALRSFNEEEGLDDCRIVLRKSYWDPLFDEDLLHNNIALDLLSAQVERDLQQGWIMPTVHQMSTCQKLIELESKMEEVKEEDDDCNEGSSGQPTLQLCFEYMMRNRKLKWINIWSKQALLMHICLQSIVNELITKKGEKGDGQQMKGQIKVTLKKPFNGFTGNCTFDGIGDDDL